MSYFARIRIVDNYGNEVDSLELRNLHLEELLEKQYNVLKKIEKHLSVITDETIEDGEIEDDN